MRGLCGLLLALVASAAWAEDVVLSTSVESIHNLNYLGAADAKEVETKKIGDVFALEFAKGGKPPVTKLEEGILTMEFTGEESPVILWGKIPPGKCLHRKVEGKEEKLFYPVFMVGGKAVYTKTGVDKGVKATMVFTLVDPPAK